MKLVIDAEEVKAYAMVDPAMNRLANIHSLLLRWIAIFSGQRKQRGYMVDGEEH